MIISYQFGNIIAARWIAAANRLKSLKSLGEGFVCVSSADNLNDFLSVFRKKPVAERAAEVDKIKDVLGRKFIVSPNPQYGDWEGAINNFVIY